MTLRRVSFDELVEMVDEVRSSTHRIETAIAGDRIAGVRGLQERVTALEDDRGGRKLYRAMVALAVLIGSAIGAASGSFTDRH